MPDATAKPSSRPLRERLFDEVDSSILILFRIVLGVTVYFWAHSFLAEDNYEPIFLEARFLFKYPGFEWVKLWPGDGIYWHFVVTKVAAICLVLGLLTRLSAAIIALAIAYVLLVERQIYVNHYYLLSCAAALLVFLPAGRRLSVDSWIGLERKEKTFPRWQLWLLRFQIGLPYVGGAIAKLNADWLAGQPGGIMVDQRVGYPIIGPLLAQPWAAELYTFGGLFFDLLVVPLLLYRPTRWFAVGLSLIFHLTNAYTLSIGVFPWFMLATLVVFFPVQTVPRRIGIFLGRPAARANEVPEFEVGNRPITWISRAGLGLAVTYVVIQLLLPIRPWIYPGDANWNERGHRFAWRMMLRNKDALTHYLLIDITNNDQMYVPSTVVLTAYQSSHADYDPELVRQTAVELRKLAVQTGAIENEIHALALVSLNGRKPKPLVDPTIDLSRVRRQDFDRWVAPDAGPLLDPPWLYPKDEWWERIEMPEPFDRRTTPARFRQLAGRTLPRRPSELQQTLEQLGVTRTAEKGGQDTSLVKPRGNPDKYWQMPGWLSP